MVIVVFRVSLIRLPNGQRMTFSVISDSTNEGELATPFVEKRKKSFTNLFITKV